MRWMLFAMAAAVAALLCLPADAAQPAPGSAQGPDRITFEQYRDWRNAFIDRRRSELAMQSADANLPAPRKARLDQVKEYYDWLAGLPAPDRDRRFHERFDEIDANHDGVIDAAERTAWRNRQRAFYRRPASPGAAAGPAAGADAAAPTTDDNPAIAGPPLEGSAVCLFFACFNRWNRPSQAAPSPLPVASSDERRRISRPQPICRPWPR